MFCAGCQIFWAESVSKSEIPEPIDKYEDIRWAAHEYTIHRTLSELKQAADRACVTCRIAYSSPTEYEHASLLGNPEEDVDVVLLFEPQDGFRLGILVEFREGGGRGIRLSKRVIASCSGLSVDDELADTLECCGALENDHTGSEGALLLARFWLNRCIETHVQCRPAKSSDETWFLPTRLLDVGNDSIRLIESKNEIPDNSRQSFVALSHCWGLVPIIRTLKANYEDHKVGIPPSKLSKTFQDAVHTTRQLGHRYLWIDSLCIIQDDSADWATEAQTMCDVYQRAALTIAAAHAPGGDVGCFAPRDGLLQLPFFVNLPESSHKGQTARIQFTSYGRVAETGGGSPALYGRAWVLQEQLLSPRMLIFDGAQLRWQCLSAHGSDGAPVAGVTRHGNEYANIRKGIMDDDEFFGDPRAFSTDPFAEAWRSRFKHQHWCEITNEFTHRGMTEASDRLVALAGVAKALARHTANRYVGGLWLDHFAWGLLWSIEHHDLQVTSAVQGFDLAKNKSSRHDEAIAPSWSWASVTVPTLYRDMIDLHVVCQVIDVRVTGEMNRQTGCATIRGHTRRGCVNAVYPFYIKEAAKKYPHMLQPVPKGQPKYEIAQFKNRLFYPAYFFLFSDTDPKTKRTNAEPKDLSKSGQYRFVWGSFRPDEVIDPGTELTFLAIAQRQGSLTLDHHSFSADDNYPLEVYTLALVPTGQQQGEYRRVGLAIWDRCAWYGYRCQGIGEPIKPVARPRNFRDDGKKPKETWWNKVARKIWRDDLELYEQCEDGKHQHSYKENELPALDRYHASVKVQDQTVMIV